MDYDIEEGMRRLSSGDGRDTYEKLIGQETDRLADEETEPADLDDMPLQTAPTSPLRNCLEMKIPHLVKKLDGVHDEDDDLRRTMKMNLRRTVCSRLPYRRLD